MSVTELGRALLGGALIGAAATFYWRANRRVAGVSGVLRGALLESGDRAVPIAFLLGLVAAGALAAQGGEAAAVSDISSGTLPVLVLAGVLVGVGTRVGGGCTSGHGVCGLSRLSRRSLVATLTFIASGALTVFAVARWVPMARLP